MSAKFDNKPNDPRVFALYSVKIEHRTTEAACCFIHRKAHTYKYNIYTASNMRHMNVTYSRSDTISPVECSKSL